MITYTRNEIENKHGQYIAYWSKQKGNTELEKYRNFDSTGIEFIIPDKQGLDMTCIVSTEEGPEGYYLVCFNNLGETIFQAEDCYNADKTSIVDCLYDYDIL